MDSGGLATSRFVRWFDHDYGQSRAAYDRVKVHLTIGMKTNIVTGVEIGDRNAHDCPHLKPMIEATRSNFKVREISTDAA